MQGEITEVTAAYLGNTQKFRPITRFETMPRLLPLGGSHTAPPGTPTWTMPTKKRTESDTEEQGTLALRLIELLNDDAVLDKLKQVLYPKELSTQLKGLNAQIVRLQQQLAAKDEENAPATKIPTSWY